jgi:polyisoprenoid-binding protein YceI
MKLLNNRLLLALMLLLSAFGYISSCTHDNEVLPPPAVTTPTITRDTLTFKPGNMTAGNAREWKMDKAHSSVLWETNYVGAAGLLTGRFNQFGTHDVLDAEMINYNTTGQPVKDTSWAFYENEPAKTYLNGYVQINTSNTGEPGRDAGCNISAMGTVPIVAGVQNLTVVNIARLKTVKVEFDKLSPDYIVALNLTWKGNLGAPITKTITGRLKYIKKATIAGAAPYDVFGLQLTFQFNCRDFGITSTSVGDKIDITCNMNFHNK